jgi:hypothetical protein
MRDSAFKFQLLLNLLAGCFKLLASFDRCELFLLCRAVNLLPVLSCGELIVCILLSLLKTAVVFSAVVHPIQGIIHARYIYRVIEQENLISSAVASTIRHVISDEFEMDESFSIKDYLVRIWSRSRMYLEIMQR